MQEIKSPHLKVGTVRLIPRVTVDQKTNMVYINNRPTQVPLPQTPSK